MFFSIFTSFISHSRNPSYEVAYVLSLKVWKYPLAYVWTLGSVLVEKLVGKSCFNWFLLLNQKNMKKCWKFLLNLFWICFSLIWSLFFKIGKVWAGYFIKLMLVCVEDHFWWLWGSIVQNRVAGAQLARHSGQQPAMVRTWPRGAADLLLSPPRRATAHHSVRQAMLCTIFAAQPA